MQKDPTLYAQVNRIDRRKADRILSVSALPETGREGQQVLMGDTPYVHSQGVWVHLDEERFLSIERRLDALEANNG